MATMVSRPARRPFPTGFLTRILITSINQGSPRLWEIRQCGHSATYPLRIASIISIHPTPPTPPIIITISPNTSIALTKPVAPTAPFAQWTSQRVRLLTPPGPIATIHRAWAAAATTAAAALVRAGSTARQGKGLFRLGPFPIIALTTATILTTTSSLALMTQPRRTVQETSIMMMLGWQFSSMRTKQKLIKRTRA